MERSIEVASAILLAVTGLSHLVQPRAWVDFFVILRGHGKAGVFVDAFLNLPLAVAIVVFHNVWSGMPIVLTLLGWALLVKATSRFCAPQIGLRLMQRVSNERAWEVQAAGAGLLGLAGVIAYGAYGG